MTVRNDVVGFKRESKISGKGTRTKNEIFKRRRMPRNLWFIIYKCNLAWGTEVGVIFSSVLTYAANFHQAVFTFSCVAFFSLLVWETLLGKIVFVVRRSYIKLRKFYVYTIYC